ncbi:hypothetical protein VB712_02080 [Spirulina sp. CCNP1310]|uniref:hypothetical protein n=1 Tax=Spirulina sp. CCNP1310 TaxID=3110249 RepID=UPI002B216509|nr:hypothetical protein [Spirulina sp. CCNP1310]MEA5417993.1 hypothetical protein [Spirulina sp. CCNP1310]
MSNTPCPTCGEIPDSLSGHLPNSAEQLKICKTKLTLLPGDGHYYRGESGQLTEFKLMQCPTCSTYFEDAHHYYSDPQSTMGLRRDEDDWLALERLSEEMAQTRLRQLG